MPFTPAHPAILWPFRFIDRRKICWTALIIGSIIPDFEYFIWMSPSAYVSHTLKGILYFNLPMTFLLAFLWHASLRKVILPLFPFFKDYIIFEVIEDFPEWLRKNWLMFFGSALVGILSHLGWDSFTHAAGYMSRTVPFLIMHVSIAGYEVRMCYILWYVCSVAGILILSSWYFSLRKLFASSNWKKFFSGYSFWGKVFFTAMILVVARIALGLGWNWTRHLVIISIGAFFYGVLLVSWLESRKGQRLQRRIK